jgi:predicted aminopeptidase
MRVAKIFFFILALGLTAGCEHVRYYNQAVQGHFGIMLGSRSVEALIDNPSTPQALKDRLTLTKTILQRAEQYLLLEPGDKYARYVSLADDYVVWNVFAAEPLDVGGQTWCYPVVGCAPYRGYYSKQAAVSFAAELHKQGFETYLGGVSAYSTLGWFDDPLLSSFIDYPPLSLAQLIFHELAHSKIWLPDNVAFNESFANFVGRQGVLEWTQATDSSPLQGYESWLKQKRHWISFRHFALRVKADLNAIYQKGDQSEKQRLAAKQSYLDGARLCYEKNKADLGSGRYDSLMTVNFNNAFLASIGTYEDYVPLFEVIFEAAEGDWAEFYSSVQALVDLSAEQRANELSRLARASSKVSYPPLKSDPNSGQQQVATDADHHYSEKVQC